jgi:uncharacterized protein (UPF0335 family)
MARGRPSKAKAAPPPPRDVTSDDNSKALREIVGSIGRLEGEIRSKKSEYAVFCKNQRKLINGHLDRASGQGFSKKVIKGLIKTRELEEKIDSIREGLAEDDLAESLDDYRNALGDFADTPLGAASAPKDNPIDSLADDDDVDLRPPHLRESEAARAAEANAAALDAGIKKLN